MPAELSVVNGGKEGRKAWNFDTPMLTNPAAYGGSAEDFFDVVIPSLPGFGFSDALPIPGAFNTGTAPRLHHLMTQILDYENYAVHGGDVGGAITERLALDYPNSLVGIHLTDVPYTRFFVPVTDPSETAQAFFQKKQQWQMALIS